MLAGALPKAASPVKLIARDSLHISKPTWWLESRFHFSFADYYDNARLNFGALRVLNDDVVQGKAGFGTHPHRDAEIFSYVVDGHLSHQDNMGHAESLPRGCVQYLSAGTGITHSEMNRHGGPVRFLQVWLTPDKRGHTPQYGSSQYVKADRHNRLLHILGGTEEAPAWDNVNAGKDCIKLHQDANVYVSELDAGMKLAVPLGQRRQAYMVCIEGSMEVNKQPLVQHDGLQVLGSNGEATALEITAGEQGTHLLLIEMMKPSRSEP